MAVEPGGMLSHYRLVEKIGEGGMGVVWKALDTTLDRHVAIKVLPESLATDSDRLTRFEREAKLLASLNHPNIAAIHGLHGEHGLHYLVMELVEGEDLARRLARGPLPPQEAWPVALQIAEALEAAHEHGVIHRDLKPANIQITADGTAKVLDFGLAKALTGDAGMQDGNPSMSPTITTAGTIAGTILGTAAYMSPEQAHGRAADRRADIWAFGCVLYEMLCGRQVFLGESVSDTLAAVLRSEPNWEALPAMVPVRIRQLLRRCLTRDPKRRLQAIGEARLVLQEGDAIEELPGTQATPPADTRSRALRFVAGLFLGALLGVAAMMSWQSESPLPVRRFQLSANLSAGVNARVAISPDGRFIVYTGPEQLWARQIDELSARPLPGTEGADLPFWSPDSSTVGYQASGKLWRVPITGGVPAVICDLPGSAQLGGGAAWGANDRIVFAAWRGALYEVSSQGGSPAVLVALDPQAEIDFHTPRFMPDGTTLLFGTHRIEASGEWSGTIPIEILSGNERRIVLQIDGESLQDPVYSPTGHLLYTRGLITLEIWGMPFSAIDLEPTGDPFPIARNASTPDVADDGTLVYVNRVFERQKSVQMVRTDRAGTVLAKIGTPLPQLPMPALSPDNESVAVAIGEEAGKTDLWIHDTARETKRRLTFGEGLTVFPEWSPDGRHIAFFRGDSLTDMAATVIEIEAPERSRTIPMAVMPSFSPDGRYLLYTQLIGQEMKMVYEALEGDTTPKTILKSTTPVLGPRLSPDGRFIAYNEILQDGSHVIVSRFPGGEGRWQISRESGFWPRWSHDGARLFYVEENTVVEVDIRTDRGFEAGKSRKLFPLDSIGSGLPPGWPTFPPGFGVIRDGEEFIVFQSTDSNGNEVDDASADIVIVENWHSEFSGR